MKIRKYFCIAFVICSLSQLVYATMQDPDLIFYENEQYNLSTHWAYTSPLEIYYLKLHAESPFTALSTANYRGFIATWHVLNNKLYLTKITIADALIPLDIIFDEGMFEGESVLASWMSGYLRSYSDTASLLLKLRKGQVLKVMKNPQRNEFMDAYYRLVNKWELFRGRSSRSHMPKDMRTLQLAAEKIRFIRDVALEKEYAPIREARQRAQEQAYRMYHALEGFEQIAEQFVIDHFGLLSNSLYLTVHEKHEQLVNSAQWYNPTENGKALYTWRDFLAVYRHIQDVVSSHTWLHEWKLAGGERQLEAHIFGITPHTENDLDFFVTSAWKHAGLEGVPRYEVLLRVERQGCATIFWGDDEDNALIIKAFPSCKGAYWLDNMDFSYHPKKDVPEYIVITPHGEWTKYPTTKE